MEVAGVADACESDTSEPDKDPDPEPETSMPPQDNNNEDPDSYTSGLFNEKPEQPPQQICRKGSKE
jgi:hypothetical protein